MAAKIRNSGRTSFQYGDAEKDPTQNKKRSANRCQNAQTHGDRGSYGKQRRDHIQRSGEEQSSPDKTTSCTVHPFSRKPFAENTYCQQSKYMIKLIPDACLKNFQCILRHMLTELVCNQCT